MAKSYRYSAYGKARLFGNDGTEIAVSALGNPYGYTGRRFDPESGLLYYRTRYYSPELGRFLTRDPAGQVDGLNVYAYVRSNPLAFVDPWGLSALPVWTPHVPPGAFVEHPCFGDDALRRYWSEEKTLQGRIRQTGGGEEPGWFARAVDATVYGATYATHLVAAFANANAMGIPESAGWYETPGPYSSPAAIEGAKNGLQLAIAQSVLEAAGGATMVAGGMAAAQGGAGLTVGSGGTAAAVGAPVALAGATTALGGVALGTHAVGVAATAYDNLQNLNAMKGNGGGGGGGLAEPKSPNRLSDSYLKKNGIDAHQLKKEALGNKAKISNYDIYIDKDTSMLWLKPKQGGPFVPTWETLGN